MQDAPVKNHCWCNMEVIVWLCVCTKARGLSSRAYAQTIRKLYNKTNVTQQVVTGVLCNVHWSESVIFITEHKYQNKYTPHQVTGFDMNS